jgi:hypothetical protein
MISEIVKNGFSKLTCDWVVEMREGEDILAVIPAQSTFDFTRSGNRLQILKSYESVVVKSGRTDNFILRNKKLDDMWLKGDVGTWENAANVEMTFDDVELTKGKPVWLDTFTFWF